MSMPIQDGAWESTRGRAGRRATATATRTRGSGDEAVPIQEATIASLRTAMSAGRLTSVELTRFYLSRIDLLNASGPELRAVIEINPDALRDAAELDAERERGRVRGPLHGLPLLVKDNLDTVGPLHTTAGSTALLGSRPERDATVVTRLRQAGAVVLGKSNLSGWISGSGGRTARGGQCRNPYQLDRSPGGSSSGSAVGVSANLCAAAIGTETVGSILDPASLNGVVGIKPTVGLTSRAGMIPGMPSMDTVGPIGRTVADAAAVLGPLTGVDPLDPATAASGDHRYTDYTRFLDPNGLRGARIGIPRRGYFGENAHADAVGEEAIRLLAALGATVVDDVELPSPGDLADRFDVLGIVQFREAKHHKNVYLARTPGEHPRSLTELIEFNREHADAELVHFGQQALEMIDAGGDDLTDPAYLEALATMHRLTRDEGIDAALGRHGLDALMLPSTQPAWKIDLVNGDPDVMSSALVPGLAGYPAVSLPAGWAHGLPVGVTFTASAWSEPKLITLASAFEHAARARRVPGFTSPAVG